MALGFRGLGFRFEDVGFRGSEVWGGGFRGWVGFPARKEGGRVVRAQLIFNSTVPDSL